MNPIPKTLRVTMEEQMSVTVSELYVHFKGDGDKLKKIFRENILKVPQDISFVAKLEFNENKALEKRVLFLHELYNNPDATSKVSNINNQV